MITERLMAQGSWDIAFDTSTPASVRYALDYPNGSPIGPHYGHVFIFDSVMPAGLGDSDLIAAARWAGVVKTRNSPWDLGGVGMNFWLGDADGKGFILETAVGTGANRTFAQYKADILAQVTTVQSGISAAVAGTAQAIYQWMTAKAALDALVTVFGMEYRVTPQGKLDTAPLGLDVGSGGLFVENPTAVVMRRGSGRDTNVVGIPVSDLKVSIDSDSYISRVIVGDVGGGHAAQSGSAVPYKDLFGHTVRVTEVFDHSSTTPAANAAAEASNLVAAGQVLHIQIQLSSDLFDITRQVRAGDWIYVYDPVSTLVDGTQELHYRGELINPTSQRVMGVTWAVERGMGVWYRDINANWTDLTPYLIYEKGQTTLEIGAASRQLLAG